MYFCDTACKAEWQRQQKPVTREWLVEKYVTEGLGAPEIAKLVGRHPKRVWEWLRDLGIPTRPRGVNIGPQFRPGHPSAFRGKSHTPESRQLIRERAIARGSVPFLRNGQHWLMGLPPESHPNWKGGATPLRQHFYSTQEWKAAVKAVWARDDARCRRCELDHRTIDRTRKPFHIHHVISFANEATRCDLDNLLLLCHDCHHWVHSRANKERSMLGMDLFSGAAS